MSVSAWSPLLAVLGMAAAHAGATDVDLAKAMPERPTQFAWHGRTVSQVVPVDGIERLVLLKAVTSAPGALDLRNLRRMLRDAAAMPLQAPGEDERRPLQAGATDTVWEAVLLMRDGGVFGLAVRSGGAQDPRHRACLTDAAGRRGCFDIPAAAPG